jgi:hypothetical protein
MSAGNPGIAAKDTKEETKAEREERVLKEFIRGTTTVGFTIADESVEEILVTFSHELEHTIAKAEEIKNFVYPDVPEVKKSTSEVVAQKGPGKKRMRFVAGETSSPSPICTVRIDNSQKSSSSSTTTNNSEENGSKNNNSGIATSSGAMLNTAPAELSNTSEEVIVKTECE